MLRLTFQSLFRFSRSTKAILKSRPLPAPLKEPQPKPLAEEPEVIEFPADENFQRSKPMHDMNHGERQSHIHENICEINALLNNASTFQVLKKYSPSLMNQMVSSKSIVEMSTKNFLAFLTYLLDFKFLKVIAGTPSFNYIEHIVMNNLGLLTPEQINNLTQIIRKSGITDEHLYLMVSVHIMKTADEFSLRSISNILNNYIHVSRKSKSFVPFYEFMKTVIVRKLGTEKVNDMDIRMILKGYSSTYNLTTNFMMILEQECLKLINSGKCSLKSFTIMMHTFNLNKSIYHAAGALNTLPQFLEENFTSMTFVELILLLQIMKDKGQFAEQHLRILGKKIIFFQEKMNLMDLKACFSLYLGYLLENEEQCFYSDKLGQTPKIYELKSKYVPALDALIWTFNKLHTEVDACDLVHYLAHINVVIDHNTREGHEFVGNLKDILKFKYQNNEISKGLEKNLIDLVNQIKAEKIRKIFLNKFN
jgi:hypothetical protein